jgi:hypothetical protein
VPDKIYVGGVPVEYILPSLKNNESESVHTTKQNGGNADSSICGPLDNKVVPVGLVVINTPRMMNPDSNKANYLYPEENREVEVVSESLYDMLIGAVLKKQYEDRTSQSTPKKRLTHNKSKKQKSK